MARSKGNEADEHMTGLEAEPGGSSQDDQSMSREVEQTAAFAGEIATRQAANTAIFLDWMKERANTTDEDQYAVMASIISEIMDSGSAEEVLREKSALHARDILNVPLVLHGFEIREGDFEDSMTGHYAALTMSRRGSEGTRVVTTGAIKVLAKLYKLDQLNEFPYIVCFTEKETKKGYGVIDMVTPQI